MFGKDLVKKLEFLRGVVDEFGEDDVAKVRDVLQQIAAYVDKHGVEGLAGAYLEKKRGAALDAGDCEVLQLLAYIAIVVQNHGAAQLFEFLEQYRPAANFGCVEDVDLANVLKCCSAMYGRSYLAKYGEYCIVPPPIEIVQVLTFSKKRQAE